MERNFLRNVREGYFLYLKKSLQYDDELTLSTTDLRLRYVFISYYISAVIVLTRLLFLLSNIRPNNDINTKFIIGFIVIGSFLLLFDNKINKFKGDAVPYHRFSASDIKYRYTVLALTFSFSIVSIAIAVLAVHAINILYK